ncbi:1-acyl-sn-glycerol-3-phosphate acyltransferase 2-like [Rosa rugosa]|uniref:1-acyl-sn-glycerol-3-phosphate acyltransferase 2-like n=1 Tax=Rosa rugosa TaxID=74645 RepID=UPI002B40B8B0|nr:1-acyl-sn-glycerol-3-phosphate acyltransferase 2-like [Rosa rugosa]
MFQMKGSIQKPTELVEDLYSRLVVVLYSLILHLIPVVLLCVSGLFANLVQAFCFVFIWPISKNAYTRINGVVKELDWLVLLGLIDRFAGVKILVCAEQETSHLKGKEHELVISNARSDADHLVELRVTSTQRMAESSVLDAHTSEAQESNSYRHYVASTTERDGGANARKIESREAS